MECDEICAPCAWGKPVSPLVPYLNHYLEMQDGLCPIGRHDLLDDHWKLLGSMRAERKTYGMERAAIEAALKAAKKKTREAH